jgi:hypothetical protein
MRKAPSCPAAARFGLSLNRIGAILRGGTPDIATVIAMQERALREQKARIDEALALLERARAKAGKAGRSMPPRWLKWRATGRWAGNGRRN